MDRIWNTPASLQDLLCELVGSSSVTGTDGERAFGAQVVDRLRALPAFVDEPDRVSLGEVEGGRQFVTALHRAEGVRETIVLISHFDTVDTAEYGPLEHLAGNPPALTAAMAGVRDELDADAVADLDAGGWLFGRGTMDMKAGLALHMALLERAAAEQWPINLLLLTVPDEEVNSAGMREAVTAVRRMEADLDLEIVLFLNSEPTFPAHPGDRAQYVYTGSIGKLLPSALCFGRETHAGTPLSGITSSYLASFLTQAMEFNPAFRETVHGESTPLPVTLDQHDLSDGYSTQTPSRTSVLYNVFVMEQTATEVMATFEQVAREAAHTCATTYRAHLEREGAPGVGDVRVLRFDELVRHATDKLGDAEVQRLIEFAASAGIEDLREQAMHVADVLLTACQELTPAYVLMFAPPYYPPVDSAADELVQACVARVREQAAERFDLDLRHAYWFNGISDLSYVSYRGASEGWATYERATPGYGTSYSIPFADMEALSAPVLNLGPFGKDPHQRTERLQVRSAFHEAPELLADLVQFVASRVSS